MDSETPSAAYALKAGFLSLRIQTFVQVSILLFKWKAAGGSQMHPQRCNRTESCGEICLRPLYGRGRPASCLMLCMDNSVSEDQRAAVLTEVSIITWGWGRVVPSLWSRSISWQIKEKRYSSCLSLRHSVQSTMAYLKYELGNGSSFSLFYEEPLRNLERHHLSNLPLQR